ncbi:MAG: glycosyltransferase family 87 protein [Pseudomonadota bacterium]
MTGKPSGFPLNRLSIGGGALFSLSVWIYAGATLYLLAKNAGRFFGLPLDTAGAADGEDLVVFYAIGSFIADARLADAYDATRFQAALPPQADEALLLNPPHAGLFFAPLSVFAYGQLKALWIIATLAAMAGAAALIARKPFSALTVAQLLSPATLASLFALQLGAFVAAGLLFALKTAQTRPKLSGFILSLLTIKPQYGLLVPIFLAGIGAWRAIFWAGVFTLAFIVAAIAAFGVAPWFAFFDALGPNHIDHGLEVHRGTINLAQELAKRGLAPSGVMAGSLAGVIIAAVAVWVTARGTHRISANRDYAVGLCVILSAYIAPSAWIYDWPLVSAGLLLLAKDREWPLHLKLAAAAAWIAPLAPLYFYASGAPAASFCALSITAVLVSVWVWRGPTTFLTEH